MARRRRTTWQRQLFEPDGPGGVLEGDRRTELVALLARLIREAAAKRTAEGEERHEQDHG